MFGTKVSLALILLASGVIAYQAQTPRDENKHANHATDAKHGITGKVEGGAQPITIQQTVNEEPSKEDQKGKTKDSAKNSHDWVDKLNASSTTIIAVFTIALFIAVWLQIETSKDIERGWVLIKRVGGPPPDWVSLLESGFVPGIVFEFTVIGHTPVRVTNARFLLSSVAAKAGSGRPPNPDLQLPPDYSKGGPLPELAGDGVVLAPKGTFKVRCPLFVTREQANDMIEGKLVMCGYGFLVYKDAFGKERETAVCYLWEFAFGGVIKTIDGVVLNPSGFRVGGPTEYNRAS